MRIAILIVGYNSANDLEDCLSSLSKSTHTNFTIYFKDNSNQRESVSCVQKYFPKAFIHPNTDNTGFAEGNNALISEALKSENDIIFLLNPDTIVDEDCLKALVSNYDSNTLLQPLILLSQDGKKTERINSYGNPLHFLGFSFAGGNGQDRKVAQGGSISLASGAAMVFPRAILEHLGGFDASYFMYHEDVDLSWRCRLAGYKIALVPEATIWHKYQFSKNSNKFFYAERNRFLFLLKNFQLKTLILCLPAHVLTEILMLLYATSQGWLPAKIKSYGSIMVELPYILKKRQAIMRIRKLNDAQLYSVLSSNLSFSEVTSPALETYSIFLRLYWKIVCKL